MSIEKLEIIDRGESSGLSINPELQDHLSVICKWAKFLAIIGIIFICLGFISMLLAGGAMATLLASSTVGMGAAIGPMITIGFLLIIAMYFVPVLYLYRFSNKTKQGIQFTNQELLNGGMNNFRKFWKFVGILTIVLLVINIVTVFGGIIAAMSMR